MRVKMSKPPPPAPTANAIGPCPTEIKIVGRPGTGSLPSTIAPPDHPIHMMKLLFSDSRDERIRCFYLFFSIHRVQSESNCHDRKCQQNDNCLVVMIKG